MDFFLHALGWAGIAFVGAFALSIVVGLVLLLYIAWREH